GVVIPSAHIAVFRSEGPVMESMGDICAVNVPGTAAELVARRVIARVLQVDAGAEGGAVNVPGACKAQAAQSGRIDVLGSTTAAKRAEIFLTDVGIDEVANLGLIGGQAQPTVLRLIA